MTKPPISLVETALKNAVKPVYDLHVMCPKCGPITTDNGEWLLWCGSEEQAQALLDAARATLLNYWQPIETAPRDGTRILCYLPFGRGFTTQTHWHIDKRGGNWYDEGGELCPTHWMPLPDKPENSK